MEGICSITDVQAQTESTKEGFRENFIEQSLFSPRVLMKEWYFDRR